MASKFDSAFAAARKSGKKTFSFGGKSYTTKMASESKGGSKTPVPKSRVGKDNGSGGRPTSAVAANPRSKLGQDGGSGGRATRVSGVTGKPTTGAKSTSPKQASASKPREAANYPVPAKDVGIAKAKSPIGQAAARQANKPKSK